MYVNRDRSLSVGDGFINAGNMGALITQRLGCPRRWTVYAEILPRKFYDCIAVVNDFGDLVEVPA